MQASYEDASGSQELPLSLDVVVHAADSRRVHPVAATTQRTERAPIRGISSATAQPISAGLRPDYRFSVREPTVSEWDRGSDVARPELGERTADVRDGDVRHVGPLDGIRAVAVALVVVVHTFPSASGGYIGVEVFFVLSGFLITSLLIGELNATGSIDRGAFYMRRALRLFPPLLLLMVLSVALAADVGSNNGGVTMSRALPPVFFYYGNWVEAAGRSLGFLSHCWSLAIEEQFYLVWPLLIIPLTKRRDAVALLIAATTAMAVLRAALTPFAPSANNLSIWTTSKGDCLLIGALLAVFFVRSPDRVARWTMPRAVGLGGAAALAAMFALLSVVSNPAEWSDYGLTTAVAMSTAVLIAHVIVRPAGAIARALSWKPAMGLGRVSYGVYLFHWPIIAWVGLQSWSHSTRLGIEFPLIAVVVAVSWLVVERPAHRLKRTFVRSRKAIAAPNAGGRGLDRAAAPPLVRALPSIGAPRPSSPSP